VTRALDLAIGRGEPRTEPADSWDAPEDEWITVTSTDLAQAGWYVSSECSACHDGPGPCLWCGTGCEEVQR